jgi:hypothetical protein
MVGFYQVRLVFDGANPVQKVERLVQKHFIKYSDIKGLLR